jgi:hypothetical protein
VENCTKNKGKQSQKHIIAALFILDALLISYFHQEYVSLPAPQTCCGSNLVPDCIFDIR